MQYCYNVQLDIADITGQSQMVTSSLSHAMGHFKRECFGQGFRKMSK